MPDQREFCGACKTAHDPRVFCPGRDPDPVGALQQPPPAEAAGPGMHDMLIDDLRQRYLHSPLRLAIEEDVHDRLEFGLRKYGQPLRAHNGRNPLLDAYQEILDCLVYLIQAMAEIPAVSVAAMRHGSELYELYTEQLRVAFTLKGMLARD